ncbi:hypothetical protein LJB42_002270 [Komagataella kurtzmanii]|nr:hypothetical protein LJB42_002270 [Komagataella kurtzmanii]
MGLGRSVKHEWAMLRNLASSLIKNESIITTKARAKKTQALVENLITKAKKNYDKSLILADIFEPNVTIPKLYNVLKPRYQSRAGGYTRILNLEPRMNDKAPQVIMELVDNTQREMKLWYTAKIVARLELQNIAINPLTQKNVDKLLHNRENGEEKFREIVEICKKEFYSDPKSLENLPRMRNDKNTFKKRDHPYKIVPRPVKRNNATVFTSS